MKRESLRDKIVRLSKELSECEDKSLQKKLRAEIAKLKSYYKPSEPESLGNLINVK